MKKKLSISLYLYNQLKYGTKEKIEEENQSRFLELCWSCDSNYYYYYYLVLFSILCCCFFFVKYILFVFKIVSLLAFKGFDCKFNFLFARRNKADID